MVTGNKEHLLLRLYDASCVAGGLWKRRKYVPVGSTPTSMSATFHKPPATHEPQHPVVADVLYSR